MRVSIAQRLKNLLMKNSSMDLAARHHIKLALDNANLDCRINQYLVLKMSIIVSLSRELL